jgi:glutamyl-tRNA synthetase
VQERLKKLDEVADQTGFFFQAGLEYEPELLIGKKMTAAQSLTALKDARRVLAELPDFGPETTQAALRDLGDRLQIKVGPLFGIVRVAVTGKTVTPPLFETMEILGQKCCLERMDDGILALTTLSG